MPHRLWGMLHRTVDFFSDAGLSRRQAGRRAMPASERAVSLHDLPSSRASSRLRFVSGISGKLWQHA
ncbi:MAG TPA: hypothetical protein VLH56_13845 [Dissulfurispiraceae bacterium]|nr:hypothetical protein [Dissulfurispiraceae bacterium]